MPPPYNWLFSAVRYQCYRLHQGSLKCQVSLSDAPHKNIGVGNHGKLACFNLDTPRLTVFSSVLAHAASTGSAGHSAFAQATNWASVKVT
jgi:hypothetical protein